MIEGAVALVTGANRGLGRAFVDALLDRGAARVYAASRGGAALRGVEPDDPRVVPVELDVTDPALVAAAAERCTDVTLLIDNAGIMTVRPLIGSVDDDAARDEMEVNYFGTLRMCRAFAPILGRNGGGAIVNVLSVASWIAPPASGSYGASKAAAWSLTNAIRLELHEQGTLVTAVHAGFIDTEMVTRVKAPKIAPGEVVAQTLDGVERGDVEILADDESRRVKAALPRDHDELYPPLQAIWDARRRR
jgi:NAD(P)-dependent dehydrogenase (short-subunit alcohol dehydrogenase family)